VTLSFGIQSGLLPCLAARDAESDCPGPGRIAEKGKHCLRPLGAGCLSGLLQGRGETRLRVPSGMGDAGPAGNRRVIPGAMGEEAGLERNSW
jgi:hypothetical protein